jgi:hypothetical protein
VVKIKVEKFLMKQGVRVGKAAIEFSGEEMGPLNGFHMVGFTICDDGVKAKYVMMPMAKTNSFSPVKKEEVSTRNFFFLRADDVKLNDLQNAILDVYDSICENEFRNTPRIKQSEVPV